MDFQEILYKVAVYIPGFLLGIVAHEYAHGRVALHFGDPTAKDSGRLTFNPVSHMDPFGSVIFPLILLLIPGGAIFGWARPVPVNTRNFQDYKKGVFWVSFAGPLANISLAILSALAFALVRAYMPASSFLAEPLSHIFQFSVLINMILAMFNLIPLPPLDGSKMVSVFLPYPALQKYQQIEQYTFHIFLGIIVLGWMGIHILAPIFAPALWAARWLPIFFLQILL